MKKYLCVIVILLSILKVSAQDIKITRFEKSDVTSVDINPVKDNTGEYCSVIRFWVRGKDDDYDIKFNSGILRRENRGGVIFVWVSKETTRITKLRYKEDIPISGYRIPIKLEPKMTYDAIIEIPSNNVGVTNQQFNLSEKSIDERMPSKFFSLGFNFLEVMGPSLSFGLNLSQHNIEFGIVYGVKTSDELYVYGNNDDLLAANYFQAFRAHLCYGFELPFPIQNKNGFHYLTVTPQIGSVFHLYKGREVVSAPENDFYKYPFSIALSIGMRLTYRTSKHFSLYLAPEYYFAVFKSMEVETLSRFDPVMRNWYSSPNLNAGIMVYF